MKNNVSLLTTIYLALKIKWFSMKKHTCTVKPAFLYNKSMYIKGTFSGSLDCPLYTGLTVCKNIWWFVFSKNNFSFPLYTILNYYFIFYFLFFIFIEKLYQDVPIILIVHILCYDIHWTIDLEETLSHMSNVSHGLDHMVVNTSRSFPHSWLIIKFVTRLTQWVSLVEQELLTLWAPEFTPGF
jgi:hypothetical protein